jgi:dihydroflavonol-4-reductase
MSRYLVTGATGFLGTHLVEQLLAEGHDVVALCHRDGPAATELAARGAQIHFGDVLDEAATRHAAEGCSGVFHCAGRVSRRPEDADLLYRVHVEGTKATLEACRRAGVARAVVASTSGVVAVSTSPDIVATEQSPTPTAIIGAWPYYRSKLYAEQAALAQRRDGLEVVCVNPTLLLGPGDLAGSSTGDVARFLEEAVPMTPAGGLSFVDVRDAAAALVLAMAKGRPGERYLVGAANMTIEAFFGRLERISGVPAPKLRMPKSVRLASVGAELIRRAAKALNRAPGVDRISAEMAQHYWYLDATRARTELGWAPRDPNDTLADTVADLYARGVVWPRA